MAAPHHDRFRLGIEAVIYGYLSAFAYGFAYVTLSDEGFNGFRLMWMAYALAFLAPLLVPLAVLAQMTMTRYAKGKGARFSYVRAAALGALNGELLILPGTAVYVLRDGRDVMFHEVLDFLAFGFTSGLVPWCAASFVFWAALKNLRIKAKEIATAKEEQKRRENERFTLKSFPGAKRP